MNEQILDLKDIHLPDPVSWWPLAPGWWIIAAGVLFILAAIFIVRKIYLSKQLKRDITAELEKIKQQFQTTQNKIQLAKSLSVLLRRASITYYPAIHIAGLTGDNWLQYLDKSNTQSSNEKKFQGESGNVLLTAPYLADNSTVEFDANALIQLCESWLLSPHKKNSPGQPL